jgi:hypothetical protein
VVDEEFVLPPLVSRLQVVADPEVAENSWPMSSTEVEDTLPEKLTVIVEDPVVVTTPVQISRSLLP